jgi:hypothetical protein
MTDAVLARIDLALREFSHRDLVAGSEVVDFLLDLRAIAADDQNGRHLEGAR